jgi:hypothetical protein
MSIIDTLAMIGDILSITAAVVAIAVVVDYTSHK